MKAQYTQDALLDKIQKLLTLSSKASEGDNEALAALEMAQRLMAKHGITSADMASLDRSVDEVTEVAAEHKWDMGYRKELAAVIADGYRCKVYSSGGQIIFFGTVTDAQIAKKAFEFAYKFIMRRGNYLYEKYRKEGYRTKGIFNSYAHGFIKELDNILQTQCRALLIVTPPQVQDRWAEFKESANSGRGLTPDKRGMQVSTLYSELIEEGAKDAREQFRTKSIENHNNI